jgi:hypothetical protein
VAESDGNDLQPREDAASLHLFVWIVTAVLMAGLLHVVYQTHCHRRVGTAFEIVQNIEFARGDSVLAILDQPRGKKPPLLPLILFTFDKLGLDIYLNNEICYAFIILLIALVGHRYLRWRPALALVVFTGLLAPFYLQFTALRAEALFTALTSAAFVATLRYERHRDWASLALLTVTVGLASSARYMGLFWLVPLTALNVFLLNRKQLDAATKRAASVAVGASLFVLPFMYNTYQKTGYLTGMSRFEERRLVTRFFGVKYGWLNNFEVNLQRMVKYTFADFGVLGQSGATHSFPRTGVEAGLLVMLVLFTACVAYASWQFLRDLLAKAGRNEDLDGFTWARFLAIEYFASFMAATLVIWTFANNDPISSRFLLPAYPFLILTVFFSYEALRQRDRMIRSTYVAVFLVAIVVQAVRLELPGSLWR